MTYYLAITAGTQSNEILVYFSEVKTKRQLISKTDFNLGVKYFDKDSITNIAYLIQSETPLNFDKNIISDMTNNKINGIKVEVVKSLTINESNYSENRKEFFNYLA